MELHLDLCFVYFIVGIRRTFVCEIVIFNVVHRYVNGSYPCSLLFGNRIEAHNWFVCIKTQSST